MPLLDSLAFGRRSMIAGSLAMLCATSSDANQTTVSNGYRFRCAFWRNLHHSLLADATVSPADLPRWSRARDMYRNRYSGRHPLFDSELRSIGVTLSEAGEAAVPPAGLPAEIAEALVAAAPLYRDTLWDEHRSQARRWQTDLTRLLVRHGEPLRARLAARLEAPWSEAPIVTDLVGYAGVEGAYTSIAPVRITIAVLDPRNQGDASFEILLHETAHAMAGPLRSALGRLGADEANRLWHPILFYVVGALVSEQLGDYRPYADRHDLWGRFWPGDTRSLIERAFAPLLRGDHDLRAAVDAIARYGAIREQG